jgi:hypothetical protein
MLNVEFTEHRSAVEESGHEANTEYIRGLRRCKRAQLSTTYQLSDCNFTTNF